MPYPGKGWVKVVEHEPYPILHVRIFRQLPRCGRMGHVSFTRLPEQSMVDYCKTYDTPYIRFVQPALSGQFYERDFSIHGNFGGYSIFVDGVETGGVVL